ncbi:hypothetical protein GSI_02850 [Ganoderma sinense ZZ0214-1]|uniref:DUF6534 domain-containing protein n=1 Tax=Ganoderma sinense ZZ0214-1 TaxID=1077348 RepID=A0A2G8SMW3_9APHY|nr:hypothetical protein GSI_02850 [Ganoderma sinense ZZ0214-1]
MDSDSPVLLTLSSLIVSRIKEALGCGIVALVVSTGVYGITILQAYIYFRSSGKDSGRLRSFVALLFILDTTSLVLAVDALWEYIVTDFGETWLLLQLPRVLAFENGITYLIATLTQCFFAYRLWGLSRGNVLLVTSIVILSFVSLGMAIVVCVRNYTDPGFPELATLEMRWLIGLANGLSVPCDVLITVGLSYYLNSKRTGFKRTDSIINRPIIYAVNRGALTAICQAGLTIVFIAFPGHLFHLPFDLLSGKLYCNTLFATLNAQKAIRVDGDNVMEANSLVLNLSRANAAAAWNGTGQRAPSERTGDSTLTGSLKIMGSERMQAGVSDA